ncbi:hypothetical protein [Acinetobacter nosocomialis]|nr:hypothetical protein [Acinetobacter nosocomialis]MBM9551843.1 hypothetical protein [Acinetobacter nosocomialis]MCJ9033433.1 hypothetical protein [Acinetobacter nosocomialis]
MNSKLIYVKDSGKGNEVYFDPQGVEGAVFNWNGKKKILEHIQEAPK